MAKVLMVIANSNFRDEELFHTKEELENAGNETVIASNSLNEATGSLGGKIKPSILVKDVSFGQYAAVVFVGGSGSALYFDNSAALTLAREFYNNGKITTAICIAPSILANAGILKGKKVTCYVSEKENLETKGAIYTGTDVEVDGKIITANGPKAAHKFGKKIAEML
ncbi:MAG: DJ-1/PfpI family protein [Candidatus Diapherotrites archaeon]